MKNLTEQLAKWMTPGDAKALLNTFTTGLGFQAVVPLGEHGVRLSLWLQKGQEEQVIIPDTSECPQSVAALILSRLGSPAVGDREQDHPAVEVELIGDIVCGECGTANHSSSLLCRRCGNGLVEQVSRSQVTQEEVLVLLHLLVARTQAESGEPERGLEVLESQLDSLPPHQLLLHEMGIYLALLGRFYEAATYLWLASTVEPWLSLTRPKNIGLLVKRLLELHASSAPAVEAVSLPLELPRLDETRMKVALGALKRALQQE